MALLELVKRLFSEARVTIQTPKIFSFTSLEKKFRTRNFSPKHACKTPPN